MFTLFHANTEILLSVIELLRPSLHRSMFMVVASAIFQLAVQMSEENKQGSRNLKRMRIVVYLGCAFFDLPQKLQVHVWLCFGSTII